MSAKRLGKASIQLDDELWRAEFSREKFLMNRRLIDTRQDVKVLRKKYEKFAQLRSPSFRKTDERKEFFGQRDKYLRDLKQCIKKAYDEIIQDSFTYPIQLRLSHGFSHRSDWRFCLYQGEIYQFDKPDYSDEEMMSQIQRIKGV